MDAEELAALRRHDQYAHAAIKACVHDLACRCHADRTHSRIEAQLAQLSYQMTELARQQSRPPEEADA